MQAAMPLLHADSPAQWQPHITHFDHRHHQNTPPCGQQTHPVNYRSSTDKSDESLRLQGEEKR